MNVIKNIHLLRDTVAQDDIEKLEVGAHQYKRFGRITFKILSFAGNIITVEVRQDRNPAENYLDQKELIKRAKDLFTGFIPGVTVHVRATPYKAPAVDQVTPEWIQKQMLEYGIKLRTIELETGLDKTNLSAWVNGVRPMSQAVKAMFFYYFKARTTKK